jgi:hypothetical protein
MGDGRWEMGMPRHGTHGTFRICPHVNATPAAT